MPLNSIYLSGWEYNRVLANKPSDPWPTMLPAEALWNGGAQFWLFENVYCTKDAFEAEVLASETLGFASGRIWQDMLERGFVKLIDWNAIEMDSPNTYAAMCKAHSDLRSQYDREKLRLLIQTGDLERLEAIKLHLLGPLLRAKGCLQNVSPNAIRHWKPSIEGRIGATSVHLAESILTDPVGVDRLRLGTTLCRHPKLSLSPEEWSRQRQEEEQTQAPLIPDLFTGVLSLPDFWKTIGRSGDVYRPGNRAMISDWNRNVDKLERLRDAAAATIWRDLHYEWLPRLEEGDEEFPDEFRTLVRDAALRSCAKYLDTIIQMAVGALTAATASLHPVLSGIVSTVIESAVQERFAQTKPLVAFYQRAFDK